MAIQLGRIADHFDPPAPDIVGTPYVAAKLGCTTDWIAMMVRDGQIPASSIIPGTGNGKPWKFRRSRIDQWMEHR
jgi:predicted DNA-binding transcriptional regulator AlpA